ncbi:MAG: DUF4203 domain-containing protein [Ilumatobacteraceae bacterium]
MQDIVVGLLAIAVGALFCFRGYLAMRVIIPIWGAFVGFFVGAALVAGFTDASFLTNLLGWLVGLAVAVLFAMIAYLYYEVSVLIVMASVGFTVGTTVMVALDVTWNWLIVVVGLAVAVALAVLAIAADVPTLLLVLLTAFAGSSAVVLGVMLLVGTAETAEFRTDVFVQEIDDEWWWYVIYGVLALAGVVAQIRVVENIRSSVRTSWTDAGGKQLRRTP